VKVITWNINSIRLRLDLIYKLIIIEQPDFLCLQETKVNNDLFPITQIKDMGYDFVDFEGESSYNGVAILSKTKPTNRFSLKLVNNDARHISITTPNGIEIHNFYIPAGGDEPDPSINKKFAHKLKYCQEICEWFIQNRSINDKIILLGDLNIAPYENDVWSHRQLVNVVSHTTVEVERLLDIYNCLDFVDSIRSFVPLSEKSYTWWSYRNKDWKKSNRGRRLDHIWTSKNIAANISESYILKEARDWLKPSDHVPVVLELNEG
jgi:exodeoxyribonuclease-3